MSRVCFPPRSDTFALPPVEQLLARWLDGSTTIVDPFARNSRIGTLRNDLNPATSAEYHMEAGTFCDFLIERGFVADAVLFDPPYSPRQISDVYQGVGLDVTPEDTQNARLYKRVRDRLDVLLRVGGLAISFGWNSVGFGIGRGYELAEVLLVSHGAAHNDTIVTVERKMQARLDFRAEAQSGEQPEAVEPSKP